MTKIIAIKATTKENRSKNRVVFNDKKVIISFSVVGNGFPVLNDLTATAISQGICPMIEAIKIINEPTKYFQNLLVGKKPFSKNIVCRFFVSPKLTYFYLNILLCKKKMLQILHNPRCGKSRTCLAFTTEANVPFEIINYLEKPLSLDDLKALLKKLGIKPLELVRQKETIWIQNYKGKSLTDTEIIKALNKYPILIERPIVVNGDKAIISRDVEKLKGFI